MKSIDRLDPKAVALGFVRATWSQDTRIDSSPYNAQQRSAALASPQYAATLSQAQQAAPGAAWNEMAAHHGYTTVTAKVVPTDDAPEPTNVSQLFTVRVSVGTVGVKAPTRQLVMFLSLQRPTTADPWRVASSSVSSDGRG